MESVTALVNLFVSLQGAILAIYFATRRHIPTIASFNVVLLVCSLSIFPLNAYTILSGVAVGDTVLQDLSNGMLAAIGPSLFLHVKHRTQRSVHRIDLFHYVPILLVVAFTQIPLAGTGFIALLVLVFGGLGVYLIATAIVLARHDGSASPWLVTAIISAGLVAILNGVIKMVVPISEVVELNTTLLFAVPIFALLFDELGTGGTSGALRVRPQTRSASPQAVRDTTDAIITYFEAGAYRRQKLTVRDIAGDLGIPVKLVSSVVNTELGKSVPELITGYRIEDVKRRLADPANDRYTILAIASMSGFGSGPRFNTVFRREVGITPSEYKRRAQKNTS